MGQPRRQLDAAFLQGRDIDRMVHVQPPPEFKKPGTVWRLNKGLYGLKEAARLWYDELVERLQRSGGQKLTGDSACIVFHDNHYRHSHYHHVLFCSCCLATILNKLAHSYSCCVEKNVLNILGLNRQQPITQSFIGYNYVL